MEDLPISMAKIPVKLDIILFIYNGWSYDQNPHVYGYYFLNCNKPNQYGFKTLRRFAKTMEYHIFDCLRL